MEESIRESLCTYFEDMDSFEAEIKNVTAVLIEMKEESLLGDEMFWNHYLSLIQRIRKNEQNEFELEKSDEITEKSMEKSEQFVKKVAYLRENNITNLERYLLAIYFEKHNRKEGGENE